MPLITGAGTAATGTGAATASPGSSQIRPALRSKLLLHLLRLVARLGRDALQLLLQLVAQRLQLSQDGGALRRIRGGCQCANQLVALGLELLGNGLHIRRQTGRHVRGYHGRRVGEDGWQVGPGRRQVGPTWRRLVGPHRRRVGPNRWLVGPDRRQIGPPRLVVRAPRRKVGQRRRKVGPRRKVRRRVGGCGWRRISEPISIRWRWRRRRRYVGVGLGQGLGQHPGQANKHRE